MSRSLTQDAAAGFTAGISGTLLGYPLDTIKVHMQSEAARRGGPGGLTRAARTIWARHGLAGFYAGVTAPMFALTILNTICFTSYSFFKNSLGVRQRIAGAPGEFDPRMLIAGALTGPVAAVVSTPFDLLKVQMQMYGHHNFFKAVSHIMREGGGVRALYVGGRVNMLREVVFGMTYFGTYELARDRLDRSGAVGLGYAVPLAGGLSGMMAWALSLPLDTVKSVVQAAPIKRGAHRSSEVDVMRSILAARGLTGFFRGATPSLLRAFVVSGTRFASYELALRMMSGGGGGGTPEWQRRDT